MDLVVNGASRRIETDPERPLLWVLRNDLDLTGAKFGCGEGQCGACTVLIDGVAHRSCLTPVGSVAGKEITTVEGLADGERLHPVQQSFIDCDAMQCGYCTPGMIMQSVALLRKDAAPSESEIKQQLEGNICRCGTYNRIVAAVQKAGQAMASQAKERSHA
ncbi:MAG: (2Fe-2S)-binding domain protein [Bryobacterales bacterium]|jgi:aerobic-type carbon monoxide dehydrogenase small subunit (CoxS/CutS family)|nr:(2Fe-2S)-binding domain protein [Bryobacterales bacterium]